MIVVLTLKDLRRRLASPAVLLINLSIPLVMAGMMALAFGGKGEDRAPSLRLLVVNHDDGPLGRALASTSQNPEAAQRLEIKQAKSREEGLRRLREEEAAALVIVPENFSQDILEGRDAELELLKNPAQSIMPIVAQQGAEVAALYLSVGARVFEGEGRKIQELFKGEGWNDPVAVAALVAVLYERVRGVGKLLLPPIIEVETKKAEQDSKAGGFDFLSWMYPGIMMMGLLFTGLVQMKDFLREGAAGTLRRQLIAPLGAGRLLTAKVVSVAAITLLSAILLMGIGRGVFGVHFRATAPFAVASACIVLATTGFAALVYALVRTERQGDTIGNILVMLMSIFGGAFFPPQILPASLRGLPRFTISYWGQEALRGLASGGGWERVRLDLAVLAVLGIGMTVAGVLLLRRRHLKGAL